MERITFRLATRADFPLLSRWLAEPHVARWWNHETSPEAVERDFGGSADGREPNEDHLVLLDGCAVGLIQYSRYADYPEYIAELQPVLPVPTGAASIDYLLGEPDLIGRGIGAAMLRAFVARTWQADTSASCLIVPVSAANEASWRTLLSIGFRLVAEGELEPDNPIDDGWHKVLRLDRPNP